MSQNHRKHRQGGAMGQFQWISAASPSNAFHSEMVPATFPYQPKPHGPKSERRSQQSETTLDEQHQHVKITCTTFITHNISNIHVISNLSGQSSKKGACKCIYIYISKDIIYPRAMHFAAFWGSLILNFNSHMGLNSMFPPTKCIGKGGFSPPNRTSNMPLQAPFPSSHTPTPFLSSGAPNDVALTVCPAPWTTR